MKKNLLWMAGAILTSGLAFTACSVEDLPLTLDEFVMVNYDFEKGTTADYFALGKGEAAIVTPEAEGSTGQAATIIANQDRGDYLNLAGDYTGTVSYTIDMDLLLQPHSRTCQFAVMAEGAWEADGWNTWLSNWGIFWKNNKTQNHTAFLFDMEYPTNGQNNVASLMFDIDNDANDGGGAYVYSGIEWTFEGNVWYHLNLAVDVTARTVNWKITTKADGAEQISGTYNVPDGDGILPKGIYERNGRYNYQPGAMAIDNVKVVANKWH